MTTMDIQHRIAEMKLWLDEFAAAYEIPDPDEATKAILIATVKLQQRLAQHAALAVEAVWEAPPQRTTSRREIVSRRTITRASPMSELLRRGPR
jgi:hypothetical protein